MINTNRYSVLGCIILISIFMVFQIAMIDNSSSNLQDQYSTCSLTDCPKCPICPTCNPITATQTQTMTKIATSTFAPTVTPTVTNTNRPTHTPTNTFTPTLEAKPYTIHKNSPKYVKNLFHPEKGCDWVGVGGQVLDRNGKWVDQIVIVIQGNIQGKTVDLISLTGVAPNYGPGGYEIELYEKVFRSTDNLTITLFDLNGNMLTYPVSFDTFEDCMKNQIIINFQENPKHKK